MQQQLFTPPVSTAQPHHNTLPCYQRSHLFDHTEWIDYHADPAGSTNFKACRSSPCPNRYDPPLLEPARGNDWALPVVESQEEAIRSHQRHIETPPRTPLTFPLTFPPLQTPQPQQPQQSTSSVVDLSVSPTGEQPAFAEEEKEPDLEYENPVPSEHPSRHHSPPPPPEPSDHSSDSESLDSVSDSLLSEDSEELELELELEGSSGGPPPDFPFFAALLLLFDGVSNLAK